MVTRVCGIYKITSPTGKVYIGQSVNIKQRWFKHKKSSDGNRISNSILKHGWDSHKKEIIHILPNDIDTDTLNTYEMFYIQAYKNIGTEMLNLTSGGGNKRVPFKKSNKPHFNTGRRHTEATRKILSEASKNNNSIANLTKGGRTIEIFNKIKIANTGKKASKETKEKLSRIRSGCLNSRYGATVLQSTRDKISSANKGNKYCLGRVLSQETKDRISAAQKIRFANKFKINTDKL